MLRGIHAVICRNIYTLHNYETLHKYRGIYDANDS
jgi:hypothetical protein